MNKTKMIPLKDCIKRRVYKIHSRNLSFGVFDGKSGFIGIRKKFSSRYLFTEYHWDTGPPFGTVRPEKDLKINVPENIKLAENVDLLRFLEKIETVQHEG